MSYYEQKIAALEARIEEMANLERMKAVKVEAQLMVSLGELNAENARLKAEVERLTPREFDPLMYHCEECQRMAALLAFATSKYIKAEAQAAWQPISTMPRYEPYKVEMFFVYRGIIGVGVYAGDDCEGEPMFKIDGGYEQPDFWMPIPSWNAAKQGGQP